MFDELNKLGGWLWWRLHSSCKFLPNWFATCFLSLGCQTMLNLELRWVGKAACSLNDIVGFNSHLKHDFTCRLTTLVHHGWRITHRPAPISNHHWQRQRSHTSKQPGPQFPPSTSHPEPAYPAHAQEQQCPCFAGQQSPLGDSAPSPWRKE